MMVDVRHVLALVVVLVVLRTCTAATSPASAYPASYAWHTSAPYASARAAAATGGGAAATKVLLAHADGTVTTKPLSELVEEPIAAAEARIKERFKLLLTKAEWDNLSTEEKKEAGTLYENIDARIDSVIQHIKWVLDSSKINAHRGYAGNVWATIQEKANKADSAMITLYENNNKRGRNISLSRGDHNLKGLNFENMASSMHVPAGLKVRISGMHNWADAGTDYSAGTYNTLSHMQDKGSTVRVRLANESF